MNDRNPINENPLPNELRSVEAMLTSLVPRGDRLDHEQLWFEAGKRAAMETMPALNRRWAIAGSSAMSAVVAIAATLLVIFWMRSPPQIVERVRVVEAPAEQTPNRESKDDAGPPALALAEHATDRGKFAPPSISLVHRGSIEPRGLRAAQLERVALMLRYGSDHSVPMSRATTAAAGQASVGVHETPTYYQQRQDLLGEQASRGSRLEISNVSVMGT